MRILRSLKRLPRRAQTGLRRFRRLHLRGRFEHKVAFVVVGMKSGTTALDAYLRQHPQIDMADFRKEISFFHTQAFDLGYDWYHTWYDPRSSQVLLGDASPEYLYFTESLQRISDYNSAMKLIVLLRNPIDRTYSDWNHWWRSGREKLTFSDCLQSPVERPGTGWPLPRRDSLWVSYVERSRYLEQLAELWKYFPREQTLVLKSEVLRDTPQTALDCITDFLEIEPCAFALLGSVNSGTYEAPMTDRERAFLHETFDADTKKLEALLGWDCSDWLT